MSSVHAHMRNINCVSRNGGGVVAAVAGQQGQWRCNRRGSGVILAVAGPKERWPCNRCGSGGHWTDAVGFAAVAVAVIRVHFGLLQPSQSADKKPFSSPSSFRPKPFGSICGQFGPRGAHRGRTCRGSDCRGSDGRRAHRGPTCRGSDFRATGRRPRRLRHPPRPPRRQRPRPLRLLHPPRPLRLLSTADLGNGAFDDPKDTVVGIAVVVQRDPDHGILRVIECTIAQQSFSSRHPIQARGLIMTQRVRVTLNRSGQSVESLGCDKL